MRHLLIPLALVATSLLSAPAALAGDGEFDSGFGAFNFGISARFDATAMQIDRVEQEFEKASDLLLDVTDGQHEFGDVVFCNSKAGGKAADIWLFASGRSRAPGKFGTAGDHISLAYTSVISNYGNGTDGSWTVAHEFGHFAYGNRDEYSGPTPGEKRCIIKPNPNDQTACLTENYKVYGANGVGLTEWCVASTHANPLGDNFQTTVNGKSCWESAKDRWGADINVPAGAPVDAPPAGSFFYDFIQLEAENRYVVVIDRSGSMSGDRIALARQGGKIFTNLAKDGDKLAVVSFHTSAGTEYPMTVMSDGTKAAAKVAIGAITLGGSTAIGDGMVQARNLILAEGDRACQQAIVLLSDGDNNSGVDPVSVIPSLKANGIVVHTIALGGGADVGLMQQIATGTKGKFFATSSAFGLNSIFAQLATETAEGGILNVAGGTLEPSGDEDQPFDFDATTTRAAFVVAWDGDPGDATVSVRSPSGDTYDDTTVDPDLDYSVDESSITVVISGASFEPGVWMVSVDNATDDALAYLVQALSDSPSVLLTARSDAPSYAYPAPMTVTSSAFFSLPVTGIDVTGVVRRPGGSEVPIELNDDGTDGDELAGDGVYTGQFTQWSNDGNYTVALDAVNDGSGAFVAGESIDDELVVGPDPITLDEFTRHTEFAVSATGVPPLELFGLAVDKLKLKTGNVKSKKNKVQVAGLIDLDEASVDPLIDPLTVEIRSGFSGLEISPDPSDMDKVGKKDRYRFKDKATGIKGMVDLFKKGSSSGRFKVADKDFSGFLINVFHPADGIFVDFRWGSMDYTAQVLAKVGKKSTSATFKGKKGVYLTEELFVTSAKLGRSLKKEDKDKLSFRAKLGAGGFSPLSGDTLIEFGTWSLTVGSADWKAKGSKFRFRSADKTTTIVYDSEREELSVTTKKQDLRDFANPVVVGIVDAGFYSQRREITMTASGNKKGAPESTATKFIY